MDEEEITASDILEPVNELFPPATQVFPEVFPPYHVFINHRGPDVKKIFASLIYHALYRHGLRMLLDTEELHVGDSLIPAIKSAICSASVQITIFSKTYAQSPWCLNELLWMLDSHSSKIIPIFYDIEPWELRYVEKGAFAEAFQEHRNKGRVTIEQVDSWIRAVNKVSCISGVVINTEEDDYGERLAQIVEIVLENVGRVPTVGHDEVETPEFYNDFKDPIDIDDLIRRMKELLRMKKEDLDEATKVAMEVVQQLGETHWIVGGLSMIAYLLFKIDKMTENRNHCLELLGYMIDLAEPY